MTTSTDAKVARIEQRLDYHEREIDSLKTTTKEMNKQLSNIQKTLDKMFYLAIGAAVTYLANTFGLTEVIKGLVL